MKSPFPGMDPYLEEHWGDVHQSLIIYARDQLQGRLPGDLRARVEERVYVDRDEENGRSLYPDVRVVERPGMGDFATATATASVAVAEPFVLHFPADEKTEGFLEIRDVRSGNRVVTVIEVISLSNKRPGTGRTLYRRKQRELMEAEVNSVEIDLLREGPYTLSAPKEGLPPECRTPYRICVQRVTRPFACEFYPVPLRARLPAIRIPLRADDADAVLDLQALIDACYANGGYDDIDYSAEPAPPLSGDDARWADELLRSRGMRT